jgi:folate-binding protein YgfZ
MSRTPLYQKLVSSGAQFGEYRGVETAARFAEPASELAALRSGNGIYDLGWQSRMVVTGEDRQRWLNGMVTNNIRDLEPNRAVYCFLLTPQGRIIGDMYVHHRGESMVIDTDTAQAEKLREVFERYIIMDDVEISRPEPRVGIGVEGPSAEQLLTQAGLDVVGLQPLETRTFSDAGEVVNKSVGKHLSYEISGPLVAIEKLWDQLRAGGASPVGSEALELWRVARGVPRYGQDISERYLPQETEQMQALHFSKGCYVGQEIVERIRSRGQVHRGFAGFAVADANAEITPGTKVQRAGKDVGEVTSVATLPSTNGTPSRKLALGYIRREAGKPGTEVQINGASAQVSNLPFE